MVGSIFTCTAPSVVLSSSLSACGAGAFINERGKTIALSKGSQVDFSSTEPQMTQACVSPKTFLLLVNGWETSASPLAMFREMRRCSASAEITFSPKTRLDKRSHIGLESLLLGIRTIETSLSPALLTAIRSAEVKPSCARSAAPCRTSKATDLFAMISLSVTFAITSRMFICSTSGSFLP